MILGADLSMVVTLCLRDTVCKQICAGADGGPRSWVGACLTLLGPPSTPVDFFSFTLNLIFFCEIKPHTEFQNPRTTPSGRKVTQAVRREIEGEESC